MNHTRPFIRRAATCFALAALPLILFPPKARAQAPSPSRWVATAGVSTKALGDLNGWGIGPAVGIRRMISHRLALGTELAALLGSTGFYDFSGLAMDLALSWVLAQKSTEVTLSAGAGTVLGGDSDGSYAFAVGPFVGAGAAVWLTPGFGLTARGAAHLWQTGATSQTLAAGVALRW